MKWLVLILLLSVKSYAGGAVGNGGDLVECKSSPANKFAGYYSLDYLLTYPGLSSENVSTWQYSLERIGKLIKEKVPELYMSYKSFQDDIFNTSYERQHVWEDAPFGLSPIDDQAIAVKLPPNCLTNGQINLIQAVIRLNPNYSGAETQVFKYMSTAIDTLNVDRPLQTSFLLVHEWLWELSKNVDRNRRVDRYFHSEAFTQHTPQEAVSQLRGMGLTIKGDAYAFDSIREALAVVAPGATVWLLDQTYENHYPYTSGDKITIDKPITIKPIDKSAHPIVNVGFEVNSDNVSIENIAFKPPIGSFYEIPSIDVVNGQQIKILNNNFYFAGYQLGDAIHLQNLSQAIISNNTFENIYNGLILEDQSSATLDNNRFIKVHEGIKARDSSNLKVMSSVFRNCSTGISLSPQTTFNIQSNTFEANDLAIDNSTGKKVGPNTFTDNKQDIRE